MRPLPVPAIRSTDRVRLSKSTRADRPRFPSSGTRSRSTDVWAKRAGSPSLSATAMRERSSVTAERAISRCSRPPRSMVRYPDAGSASARARSSPVASSSPARAVWRPSAPASSRTCSATSRATVCGPGVAGSTRTDRLASTSPERRRAAVWTRSAERRSTPACPRPSTPASSTSRAVRTPAASMSRTVG